MSGNPQTVLLSALLVLAAAIALSECNYDGLSGRELLAKMQKYAKKPPSNGTGPSRVLVGIYIESMGNFQAADMSFDVDLYLYSHWRDPTLNHSSDEYLLVNDPKVRDRIWVPDLYFANARTSKFHDVTIPNFSMFIDRHGNIAYSTRITLNVACNLELANYPMDRQTCGIRMLSYAYVASQVNVTWHQHDPTRYNPEIGLPEFKIVRLTPEACDGTYMYAIMSNTYKLDKFSCLEAVIHLNRQIGYHVVQSFIPTGLIVMISWVSFWIDRRAVPARVTLSFTTLLSLSTLGNGLRFGLPQVAYAKAIDFWFGSCMFFVFLSLVEFAAVNSYMREAEKYERLATYSAKKELHMMSDGTSNEQNLSQEDCLSDDSSASSRSPVIGRPNGNVSTGKKNNNNNISNVNNAVPSGRKKAKRAQESVVGARLRHWTNTCIAIPHLFGNTTVVENGTSHGHHNQKRHPSISEKQIMAEELAQLTHRLSQDGGKHRLSNCCEDQLRLGGVHLQRRLSKCDSALALGHHRHGAAHRPSQDQSADLPPRARPLPDHLDLRSIDADESDSLAQTQISPRMRVATPPPPVPAKTANSVNHLPNNAVKHNNNSSIVHVPGIRPWPPSPMLRQQTQDPSIPPPAPRRVRKVNLGSQEEGSDSGHNPLATNHFLREGFRYSRKGLNIDKWSRLLFPLAFTLWNAYYWTYYLWYIQGTGKDY